MPVRITDEQIESICDGFFLMLSNHAIAQRVNVSVETVVRYKSDLRALALAEFELSSRERAYWKRHYGITGAKTAALIVRPCWAVSRTHKFI